MILFVKISAILTANIKIDNGRMRHDANMPRYLRRFSSSKGGGGHLGHITLLTGDFFLIVSMNGVAGLYKVKRKMAF